MKLYDLKLVAGESSFLSIAGDFVGVLSATDDFNCELLGSDTNTDLFAGLSIKPEKPYHGMMLESKTSQTIRLVCGFGSMQDSRLVLAGSDLSVDLQGSNTISHGVVSVADVATLIVSSLDRKSVLIQALDNDIYVGGSGVTVANGLKVSMGNSLEIKTKAAVYGVCSSGTCDVRYLSEV